MLLIGFAGIGFMACRRKSNMTPSAAGKVLGRGDP
jgi:hypothetical protein